MGIRSTLRPIRSREAVNNVEDASVLSDWAQLRAISINRTAAAILPSASAQFYVPSWPSIRILAEQYQCSSANTASLGRYCSSASRIYSFLSCGFHAIFLPSICTLFQAAFAAHNARSPLMLRSMIWSTMHEDSPRESNMENPSDLAPVPNTAVSNNTCSASHTRSIEPYPYSVCHANRIHRRKRMPLTCQGG